MAKPGETVTDAGPVAAPEETEGLLVRQPSDELPSRSNKLTTTPTTTGSQQASSSPDVSARALRPVPINHPATSRAYH